MRLLILKEHTATDINEFVNHWSSLYDYKNE
jgi:hypothetical protein